MKKILFLLLPIVCACSSNPKIDASDPAEIAKQEQLKQKWDSLSAKIKNIQDDYKLPAAQAFIFDRSEFSYKYSHGVRAVNSDAQIGGDDKFHLGGSSKVISAILAAQLIDQKIITWSSTLRELLGKDIGMNSQLGNITLEMLLTQRSGLIDIKKLKVWPTLTDRKISTARGRELLVRSILSYDPQFQPNSKTSYTDSNVIVLGWALEKLTNFSWEDLVKNKIFIPMGMNSCGFGLPGSEKAEKPDQPWGHTLKGDELVAHKPVPGDDFPQAYGPAGTIHCSAADWAKLLKEINLGLFQESFLLQEATFQKLLAMSAQPPHTASMLSRYDRIWSGGATLTATGSHPSFFSLTALAPGREISLIVFVNAGTAKAQEGATKILKLLTEAVQ